MNPWRCALLITLAGAIGGLVNALLSDNGFILPRQKTTTMNTAIWCPGAISNILIGAFSAASPWAFYGSGASIDLGQTTERAQVSLKMSALAGALIVGVGGARWLTNEVDKRLLKESATVAPLAQ